MDYTEEEARGIIEGYLEGVREQEGKLQKEPTPDPVVIRKLKNAREDYQALLQRLANNELTGDEAVKEAREIFHFLYPQTRPPR